MQKENDFYVQILSHAKYTKEDQIMIQYISYADLNEFYSIKEVCRLLEMDKENLRKSCEKYGVKPMYRHTCPTEYWQQRAESAAFRQPLPAQCRKEPVKAACFSQSCSLCESLGKKPGKPGHPPPFGDGWHQNMTAQNRKLAVYGTPIISPRARHRSVLRCIGGVPRLTAHLTAQTAGKYRWNICNSAAFWLFSQILCKFHLSSWFWMNAVL